MYSDEFKHQLPDIDPAETQDWIDSLDQVVDQEGEERARFLVYKLLKRARQLQVGLPPLTQTRYINTISPEQEPSFPGDEADRAPDPAARPLERGRRWSCARTTRFAGHRRPPLDLRLGAASTRSASTTSSAARTTAAGRPGLLPGPRGAGHLRPGLPRGPPDRRPARPLPARGRARAGPQLVPAPAAHARLLGVPDRLDGPRARSRRSTRPASTATCSTAASPTRPARASGRSSATARWTSPSRSARSRSPAREGLDNLTFVVNCNLQRLDGPVRGNGKIIQELEGLFRGAGWNVIKVIWGREWDDLLARDVDGVLVEPDERDARRRVPEVLGRRRRLHPRALLRARPAPAQARRAPVRRRPDRASAAAATTTASSTPRTRPRRSYTGAPTVILAKTIKGWTLGPGVEARNITHQAKKLSEAELRVFRDRLELPIPDEKLAEAPVLPPGPRLRGGPVPPRAPPRARRPAAAARRPGAAAAGPGAGGRRRVRDGLDGRRSARRWSSPSSCAT